MTSVVSRRCRLCKISLTWSVSFWSSFFFSFISVSGSVIWDCHTAQEKKIKKQNLGERKWKTCPSVFLYLARGFFIIKVLGCKQMSAEPSPVQTSDRTGRRFVLSAAATHLAALCWGRCLRQRRKKCDAGSDVLLIPLSAGCCSRRILPKRCSNRLSYFCLIQLFVAVFMFDFELVWMKTQKLEWSGAPSELFDQSEIFLKEGVDY